MQLELMSMEELNKLIKQKDYLKVTSVEREAAARELAKRENKLYYRPSFTRSLTINDYLY